jgi:hypothetical protein
MAPLAGLRWLSAHAGLRPVDASESEAFNVAPRFGVASSIRDVRHQTKATCSFPCVPDHQEERADNQKKEQRLINTKGAEAGAQRPQRRRKTQHVTKSKAEKMKIAGKIPGERKLAVGDTDSERVQRFLSRLVDRLPARTIGKARMTIHIMRDSAVARKYVQI